MVVDINSIPSSFKERCKKHLQDLKTPLSLDKYKISFPFLSDKDKTEINNWIDLSLKFFEKLKKDGHHSLQQRYPNLNIDSEIDFTEFVDRDYRKINNIAQTQIADQEIIKCANDSGKKEIAIRFKLFEYLIYSESILFLLEDIIRSIANNKFPFLVMGKLKKHIIENLDYTKYTDLFTPIDENLRNAIGHSDYEITDNTIKYFYYAGKIIMSEISIELFQNKLLKLSFLFNILLYQIDKPFVNEVESIYSKYLD